MSAKSAFFEAIRNGDLGVVSVGLLDGIHARDADGYSPLLVAAGHNRDDIVELLVKGGCDINENVNGWTPLYAAVRYHHFSTAKLLVSLGANVFQTLRIVEKGKEWIGNALTYATENDLKEVVAALATSIFNKQYTEEQIADFFGDIKNGDKEKVKVALSSLPWKHVVSEHGFSPLVVSCGHQQNEIVTLLLDSGADANEYVNGYTPLFAAVEYNHLSTVQLLLRRGANPDAQLTNGKMLEGTALLWSAHSGNLEITELLAQVTKYIDVARPEDNATAIYAASLAGHAQVVHILLLNGADPNIITRDGDTALLAAARRGYTKVVHLLLDSAAVNHADSDGKTALHFAAWQGNVEMVIELLSRGAAVNQGEIRGYKGVPLHYAVAGNHYVVVKILLDNYADKERKDKDGFTPLQIAEKKKYSEVAALFSKSRVVSEDILNNLLDQAKLSNKINQENRELIKRSMGLMQAIANTKCPTCIAVLPAPKERLLSKDTITSVIWDHLSLHILCEADGEAHFTGESFDFDKIRGWVAKIAPFVEVALALVKIASVALGAASAVSPIADYLTQLGIPKDADKTMESFQTTAKEIFDIKSDLNFSSAEDAVKALENAARGISEADKKNLEKFLADKTPELKQRAVAGSDGTVTYRYLCSRHYVQYDQSGAKVASGPSYPFRAGTIKILTISASGIDASKAHCVVKLLGSSDVKTDSAKSNNKEFKWTSPGELKVTRVDWLVDFSVEIHAGKIISQVGSAYINMFELVDQLTKNKNSLLKEVTVVDPKKPEKIIGKLSLNLVFVPSP